jgi:Fe-S cluster biogenesis protein NfuA
MTTKEDVEKVLDEFVRPGLQMDGGDIDLVDYNEKDGVVQVRLTGRCHGCPMSQMTLQMAVERTLKDKLGDAVKQVVPVL